jgi:hypothetical protein
VDIEEEVVNIAANIAQLRALIPCLDAKLDRILEEMSSPTVDKEGMTNNDNHADNNNNNNNNNNRHTQHL